MATGRRHIGALALCSALVAGPATAQVVVFEPQAQAVGPVGAAYAANALVSCDSGDPRCADVRAGRVEIQNTQIEMRFIDADPLALGDVDGDGRDDTVNASAARLDLPEGAVVERALLYVGGIWSVDNVDRCGDPRAIPPGDRTRVRFAPPGAAAYVDLDGALLGDDAQSVGAGYAAVFDVGPHLDGPGEIWVADAALIEGPCAGGGWALAVVYRAPDAPPRTVALFAGYARVNIDARVEVTADGLLTPPAGPVATEIAVGAVEGDRGLTGDQLTLDGQPIGDAANPADDFFNSNISRASEIVLARTPAHVNTIAFDFDVLAVDGPADARRLELGISTSRDIVKAFFVGVAIDLAVPDVTLSKRVENLDRAPGAPARPGDRLRYTLEATPSADNTDGVVDLLIEDTLPDALAWVEGRLETRGPGGAFEAGGASHDPDTRLIRARFAGPLAPGEAVAVRFEARLTASGPVENTGRAVWSGVTAGPGISAGIASDGDPDQPGLQPTVVVVPGPDMGPPDQGLPDMAPAPDGGTRPDGGVPLDLGPPLDAGILDARDGADLADPDVGRRRTEDLLADGEEVGGGLVLGCAAGTPGGPAPVLWLLALGALVTLRRRHGSSRPPLWPLALLLLWRPAMADDRFAAQRFAPTTDLRQHGLRLVSARPHPGPQWSATLLVDHADDPLVVRVDDERTRSLVAGHTRAHLLASGALSEDVEVGVAIPVMLDATGDAVADGPGVGDMRIQTRFVLWQQDEEEPRSAVALAMDAYLGTGDLGAFHGDGLRFEPRLAAAQRLAGGVDMRINLGWQFRDAARLGNLEVDDLLTFGIGAEIPLSAGWALLPEIDGALSALSDSFDAAEAPIEALIAARWTPTRTWVALLGAGAGISPGAGVPDWRIVAGFGFARILQPW